ncbi:unnamed protein product [Symbiodinium necroappetens]|uniref:Calx-beta domain-containing protein n=1 Tax=Symbiodinium necroappetens TaxID=1628268 RepID=A0A813CL64_9DINO|nr:unnamed protein product [Symbiodinium necroappetens]
MIGSRGAKERISESEVGERTKAPMQRLVGWVLPSVLFLAPLPVLSEHCQVAQSVQEDVSDEAPLLQASVDDLKRTRTSSEGNCSMTLAGSEIYVLRALGFARVEIIRAGDIDSGTVTVWYETHDGTAKNWVDYVQQSGELNFSPGGRSGHVDINLYGPVTMNETVPKFFYFSLTKAVCGGCSVSLGKYTEAEVFIERGS